MKANYINEADTIEFNPPSIVRTGENQQQALRLKSDPIAATWILGKPKASCITR